MLHVDHGVVGVPQADMDVVDAELPDGVGGDEEVGHLEAVVEEVDDFEREDLVFDVHRVHSVVRTGWQHLEAGVDIVLGRVVQLLGLVLVLGPVAMELEHVVAGDDCLVDSPWCRSVVVCLVPDVLAGQVVREAGRMVPCVHPSSATWVGKGPKVSTAVLQVVELGEEAEEVAIVDHLLVLRREALQLIYTEASYLLRSQECSRTKGRVLPIMPEAGPHRPILPAVPAVLLPAVPVVRPSSSGSCCPLSCCSSRPLFTFCSSM